MVLRGLRGASLQYGTEGFKRGIMAIWYRGVLGEYYNTMVTFLPQCSSKISRWAPRQYGTEGFMLKITEIWYRGFQEGLQGSIYVQLVSNGEWSEVNIRQSTLPITSQLLINIDINNTNIDINTSIYIIYDSSNYNDSNVVEYIYH